MISYFCRCIYSRCNWQSSCQRSNYTALNNHLHKHHYIRGNYSRLLGLLVSLEELGVATCPRCEEIVSTSENNLANHLRTKHPPAKTNAGNMIGRCRVQGCHFEYNSMEQRRAHLVLKHPDGFYMCPFKCPFKVDNVIYSRDFLDDVDLNVHLILEHGYAMDTNQISWKTWAV